MYLNTNSYRLILFLLVLLSASCSNDDEYQGLEIVTEADIAITFQDRSVSIAVLANDTNISENSSLSVGPSIGTISIHADGTIEYTPAIDFTGEDQFQYSVCNGSACQTESVTVTVVPPVQADLNQIPYQRLSEYQFFYGNLHELNPVPTLLPYEPVSVLFSDYAHKKRFVWLPENTKAAYTSDSEVLLFPVGSVLIKSFFYENVLPNNTTQLIETRLMIKKESGWTFANYFWNESQTEAFLDTASEGGFIDISWIQNNEIMSHNYRMPSTSECFTCHKSNSVNNPIGLKPQHLNAIFTYTDGSKNQIQQWIDLGYLEDNVPSEIVSLVDYTDVTAPLDLRVRSYFDINCAHCHVDGGHCDYRSMRFAFNENEALENRGVCVTPDTAIPGEFDNPKIIKPGDPDNSIIHRRLNTAAEELRMPLLGRRMIHKEGVALIEEWIHSLSETCN